MLLTPRLVPLSDNGCLPKDTPVTFFHGGVKAGGLGILQLRKWVSIIRINRMSAMAAQSKSNEDEFLLDALKDNSSNFCEYRKFGKSKGPAAKKQLKQETAESLYNSVDGCGLQSFSQVAGISHWIVDGRSIQASTYNASKSERPSSQTISGSPGIIQR